MLGLRRGHPLQQIAAGEKQPDQRAHDRVRHQPRLVGDERDRQTDLRRAEREIGKQRRESGFVWRCRRAAGLAQPEKESMRGSQSSASTNRVHIQGEICGASHPASRVRNMHGAESVRRRLSIIFQRLIAGIEILRRSSFERPPRPKIQGRSCQSPRAQRCWRAAAAS